MMDQPQVIGPGAESHLPILHRSLHNVMISWWYRVGFCAGLDHQRFPSKPRSYGRPAPLAASYFSAPPSSWDENAVDSDMLRPCSRSAPALSPPASLWLPARSPHGESACPPRHPQSHQLATPRAEPEPLPGGSKPRAGMEGGAAAGIGPRCAAGERAPPLILRNRLARLFGPALSCRSRSARRARGAPCAGCAGCRGSNECGAPAISAAAGCAALIGAALVQTPKAAAAMARARCRCAGAFRAGGGGDAACAPSLPPVEDQAARILLSAPSYPSDPSIC
jgi:hypothetical protein